MLEDEAITRAKMALAQSKKVEREARFLKQMCGGLSELLQLLDEAQGENNGSSSNKQDEQEG